MEKKNDDYEKFKERIETRQKKLNEAVDITSNRFILKQLSYGSNIDKILSKPCHLSFDIIPGNGSSIGFSGSRAQMMFAVASILNHDGEENFFDNLTDALVLSELLHEQVLESKKTSLTPSSEEELRVMEELAKKNPEELKNLKDKLK